MDIRQVRDDFEHELWTVKLLIRQGASKHQIAATQAEVNRLAQILKDNGQEVNFD